MSDGSLSCTPVERLFSENKIDECERRIVLPRPPNDTLKYCYIYRKRWLINTGIAFSVGGMITGLILFTNSVNLYFSHHIIARRHRF